MITADKFKPNFFGKNVKLITPNTKYFNNKNRFVKSIVCTYLLIKNFKKSNALILSLQSNFFQLFLQKAINAKIIIRLNTSPEKYISNIYKKIIFKFLYNLTDEIIVNSYDFKKNLYNNFYLNSKVILNPIKINKTRKKLIFSKILKD